VSQHADRCVWRMRGTKFVATKRQVAASQRIRSPGMSVSNDSSTARAVSFEYSFTTTHAGRVVESHGTGNKRVCERAPVATSIRMLVTGVSGAPFSAVVRKVASSAGAPLASNATAASVSATRFSFKVLTCRRLLSTHAQRAAKQNQASCDYFHISSPRAMCFLVASFADHRVHELIDRLTFLGNALSQTSFKFISCLFQHAR
jgi:hypothetical protein